MMSYFRDIHDDGDLRFSVLEKTVQCQSYGTGSSGFKDLKGGRVGALS